MSVGKNIKHYRKLSCLKQIELAEILNISDVFMGYIEQGRKKPSIELLIAISTALKIPMSYLIADTHKDNKVYYSGINSDFLHSLTDNELKKLVAYLKVTFEYFHFDTTERPL